MVNGEWCMVNVEQFNSIALTHRCGSSRRSAHAGNSNRTLRLFRCAPKGVK
jgi:hypothetical protein